MTACLWLLVALAPSQDPDAEKLKQFEESFKKKESPERSSRGAPQDSKSKDSFEDDDDDDWDFIGDLFEIIFAYPFCDWRLRFDDYPYAHGRKYYRSHQRPTRLAGNDPPEKEYAWEAALSASRIEHDLWSVGLRGTFRMPSGCDFTVDWTQFTENVDDGTDRLSLAQFQLNIGGTGGAKARSYQWSAGFGVATLGGEDVSDVGGSLQGALVLHPFEPFSLRFSAAAMVFSSATLNDFRAELGFHINRFAVTAGVRSLISSRGGDDLTGPTLGFAVFF